MPPFLTQESKKLPTVISKKSLIKWNYAALKADTLAIFDRISTEFSFKVIPTEGSEQEVISKEREEEESR